MPSRLANQTIIRRARFIFRCYSTCAIALAKINLRKLLNCQAVPYTGREISTRLAGNASTADLVLAAKLRRSRIDKYDL